MYHRNSSFHEGSRSLRPNHTAIDTACSLPLATVTYQTPWGERHACGKILQVRSLSWVSAGMASPRMGGSLDLTSSSFWSHTFIPCLVGQVQPSLRRSSLSPFSYDLRWESFITNESWGSFGFITATHHNLLFLRTHTNRFGMRTVDSFGEVLSVGNHVGAGHSPCALQDDTGLVEKCMSQGYNGLMSQNCHLLFIRGLPPNRLLSVCFISLSAEVNEC